jgi:hypothetical protein
MGKVKGRRLIKRRFSLVVDAANGIFALLVVSQQNCSPVGFQNRATR